MRDIGKSNLSYNNHNFYAGCVNQPSFLQDGLLTSRSASVKTSRLTSSDYVIVIFN